MQLVKKLIDQCNEQSVVFELICLDDGSNKEIKDENRQISGLFGVNYVELSENIGRSKIRNRLSKLARYERLLFLDCDSVVKSPNFIANYLPLLATTKIYSGGRLYEKTKPDQNNRLLHWYIGIKKESAGLSKRNKSPINFFHANNFIIPREIALKFPFDQNIAEYGYEDIELATRLKASGISINHIENPVYHGALKSFEEVLNDQKMAASNLATLYFREMIVEIKMIKLYSRLKKYNLLRPIVSYVARQELVLTKSLKHHPKKLYILDLLKLYYFDQALCHLKLKGGRE